MLVCSAGARAFPGRERERVALAVVRRITRKVAVVAVPVFRGPTDQPPDRPEDNDRISVSGCRTTHRDIQTGAAGAIVGSGRGEVTLCLHAWRRTCSRRVCNVIAQDGATLRVSCDFARVVRTPGARTG